MSELPHATVAVIVPRDGKYLMVSERSEGKLVYNQPAGHVELNETLLDAARRETLEETGWLVQLSNFLGVYHYDSSANGISYIRHCFVADVIEQQHAGPLDNAIVGVHWFSQAELENLQDQLRSPMVSRAIADYEQGQLYPLDVIRT